ncbi:hypothetical protein SDC9_191535 [bioreactor metagenome]|uniref:Uncharacterized protein n=1 Tax=bioreactor metagenome TaxID=1076179 RepID=A0A645I6E8_9ZZZZ
MQDQADRRLGKFRHMGMLDESLDGIQQRFDFVELTENLNIVNDNLPHSGCGAFKPKFQRPLAKLPDLLKLADGIVLLAELQDIP